MAKELTTKPKYDLKQTLFLSYYMDPKSKTFGNAKQSALRAGYAEHYANNIMAALPVWLRDKLEEKDEMLAKAERNLREFLDLPSKTQAMGAFGPIFEKIKVKGKGKKAAVKKKPVMTHNIGLIKIKADTSQFIAERIGRKKYAPKLPDGGNIFNINLFTNEQRIRIAKRIIGGGSDDDRTSEAPSR